MPKLFRTYTPSDFPYLVYIIIINPSSTLLFNKRLDNLQKRTHIEGPCSRKSSYDLC